jgi:hypothetical protein
VLCSNKRRRELNGIKIGGAGTEIQQQQQAFTVAMPNVSDSEIGLKLTVQNADFDAKLPSHPHQLRILCVLVGKKKHHEIANCITTHCARLCCFSI